MVQDSKVSKEHFDNPLTHCSLTRRSKKIFKDEFATSVWRSLKTYPGVKSGFQEIGVFHKHVSFSRQIQDV